MFGNELCMKLFPFIDSPKCTPLEKQMYPFGYIIPRWEPLP